MTSVSALVVLYNEEIGNIASLGALLEAEAVSQIVICDNSDRANSNEHEARRLGLDYVSMGGNAGLPKAYNEGIGHCRKDIVCILDDDTRIVEGYFEALERFCQSGAAWDIALPVVTANGSALSPVDFNGFRARAIADAAYGMDMPRLSGINSGMAVRRYVYDAVRYDERLFLDLVDHRFCVDAKQAGFNIAVCPEMRLEQSYSLTTDTAPQAARRYEIYKRDAREFYSGSPAKRLYCAAMLAYRRLNFKKRYGISIARALDANAKELKS